MKQSFTCSRILETFIKFMIWRILSEVTFQCDNSDNRFWNLFGSKDVSFCVSCGPHFCTFPISDGMYKLNHTNVFKKRCSENNRLGKTNVGLLRWTFSRQWNNAIKKFTIDKKSSGFFSFHIFFLQNLIWCSFSNFKSHTSCYPCSLCLSSQTKWQSKEKKNEWMKGKGEYDR